MHRSRPEPRLIPRRAALTLLCGGALAPLSGCADGGVSQPFEYTLLDGSRHRDAALRGKVVLVNFWATTCAVCVREMPQLSATHLKYRTRGFETLAVALRQDAPARVAHFAQSRALPFGVVIDNTGSVERAFGGVNVTPTSLLIDKRGAIVKRFTGALDVVSLHARVEALLAQA